MVLVLECWGKILEHFVLVDCLSVSAGQVVIVERILWINPMLL